MQHQQLLDLLQWTGGGCYLLNKVFMSIRERADERGNAETARRLRIAAWGVYCLGLPPIVVMLGLCRNWIAASVETSGAPSMVLGLYLATKRSDTKPPVWLDRLALICIPIGFAYSLHDFGGLNQLTQWLEIGLVVGFLAGTYQLARDRINGYLWYVLMHLSCGWLMWAQGQRPFAIQQVISLLFIADAYITRRRRKKAKPTHSRAA